MGAGRADNDDWLLLRPDGSVACERCAIADSPRSRMRGLLGRSGMDADEGLLIRPTNSVHMFFMRFAIDVVFLDRDLAVKKIVGTLRPWRMAGCRGARAALELPAGSAALRGIAVGERLVLEQRHG
ncbi:MAG TPA: DUF192 domain-containing protein [Solirubrobacteraceae bacterium]|nr:DUF192 domain-containing protein [Solirubrobacteraceae bacterium]